MCITWASVESVSHSLEQAVLANHNFGWMEYAQLMGRSEDLMMPMDGQPFMRSRKLGGHRLGIQLEYQWLDDQ